MEICLMKRMGICRFAQQFSMEREDNNNKRVWVYLLCLPYSWQVCVSWILNGDRRQDVEACSNPIVNYVEQIFLSKLVKL